MSSRNGGFLQILWKLLRNFVHTMDTAEPGAGANPPDTSSSARFYSTRPQSAAWENIEPLSGKQEQMASSPPPPLPGPGSHPGNYISTRALGAATDRHTGQTTLQSLWVKYSRNFKQIPKSSRQRVNTINETRQSRIYLVFCVTWLGIVSEYSD